MTARRDFDTARRFFRKATKDMPLLAPGKIGTDGAGVYPAVIKDSADEGLVPTSVFHRVSKHLQQVIESDHFRIKQMMPKVGGFRSFATARRTIAGLEAMLWLRKGFGFVGRWTMREQNDLLGQRFGLQMVNKT